MNEKQPLAKVAKEDEDWVSPEVATEVLKRSQDGSQAVSGEQVKAELAEMERKGL